MDSISKRRLGAVALVALLGAMGLMSGCMMTPEDKAFYGRGWINPDELDQDPTPPRDFNDPTAIQPHMMGPGEY
jgi:hypothetical protein